MLLISDLVILCILAYLGYITYSTCKDLFEEIEKIYLRLDAAEVRLQTLLERLEEDGK